MKQIILIGILATVFSCSSQQHMPSEPSDEPLEVAEDTGDESVLGKIEFDLDEIDEQGFIGQGKAKRYLDYEFKIPKLDKYRKEVSEIDPSVRFMPGSRGRVGATTDEILCIGSTSEPGFKERLQKLAALPYVERIIICYWE